MNELVEIEVKRYKLYHKLAKLVLTQQEANEAEYLRHIEVERELKYEAYYKKYPFLFLQEYKKLEEQNKENCFIDIAYLETSKLIEYSIYLKMRSIAERGKKSLRQKFVHEQNPIVYAQVLNQLRNKLPVTEGTSLAYRFYFVDSKISQLKEEKPMVLLNCDREIAANRLRTLASRKLTEKLLTETLSKDRKKLYLTTLEIIINQISHPGLKQLLIAELTQRKEELSTKVVTISSYQKRKLQTT